MEADILDGISLLNNEIMTEIITLDAAQVISVNNETLALNGTVDNQPHIQSLWSEESKLFDVQEKVINSKKNYETIVIGMYTLKSS